MPQHYAPGAGLAGGGQQQPAPAPAQDPEPIQAQPGANPQPAQGEFDEESLNNFMIGASELIYGGSTKRGELNDSIASMLRRNANDPVQALAETAAQVTTQTVGALLDKRVEVDPAVVVAANFEIVKELGMLAMMEGIYDYTQDEMNAAAPRAAEAMYAATSEFGIFSQEEAMQDAGQLVEASQTGEMDEAIRELERADQPAAGAGIAGM